MSEAKRVLAFMAHPDDIEFLCAGTLARLRREAGCHVTLATATTGDCGSTELGPAEISRVRYRECLAGAAILQADYLCAECMDLLVMYDRPTVLRFLEIVRRARPDIVITHSPVDYMADHETVPQLVRAATFGGPVPNLVTEAADPVAPTPRVPHLYYADPLDGRDHFAHSVEPEFVVDISSVIDVKEQMLTCHASQREWLRAHHGIDQYLIAMKEASAARGRLINVQYGEGFRQHLGHAYPQDNLLLALLGEGAQAR
ncbi:MAG TPA: PIG-L family deacetylase [Phycisphaerae bacterium]|nr:PIG-L family deacetylase [Phycisphaerae bacterium]